MVSSMSEKKFYPWLVVGLLWFVALLNYLDRQMLSAMKPSMMLDIKELATAENFGRLMAVFLWIYALMSPLSGIIADRLNRKWLIVGSLFVWSGVTLSMGFATTFNQIYVLRTIMGISEAFYIPAGLSLIADYHQGKTRSFAIDPTVKTSMGMELNRTFKGLGMLLGNVAFWVLLFYFSEPSLPGWAAKNWFPTLLSDALHMDMAQAGPIATITIAMASFVGILLGGWLSDRWVMRNLKGRIYMGVIGLSLTLPALWLLGSDVGMTAILVGGLLFGLGFGIFEVNNMPILCQFVSARYRATAYGLMNLAGISAGAVITEFLGRSADNGNMREV